MLLYRRRAPRRMDHNPAKSSAVPINIATRLDAAGAGLSCAHTPPLQSALAHCRLSLHGSVSARLWGVGVAVGVAVGVDVGVTVEVFVGVGVPGGRESSPTTAAPTASGRTEQLMQLSLNAQRTAVVCPLAEFAASVWHLTFDKPARKGLSHSGLGRVYLCVGGTDALVSLSALPLTKALADSVNVAVSFLKEKGGVWGRDYVTLALLAKDDSSLTDLASEVQPVSRNLRAVQRSMACVTQDGAPWPVPAPPVCGGRTSSWLPSRTRLVLEVS